MFPISLSILFQGFFTALRLVAACQMGREPALTNILPMDPPPKFVGLETTKWTIEVCCCCSNTVGKLTILLFLLRGEITAS